MPRRILEGKVVSNKCAKTVTVLVERKVRDPLYGKIIRRSAKYAAHDESGAWQIGDRVSIEECSPISKTKKWRVIGGKALGESQAKTVDDADEKHALVKKSAEAAEESAAEEKAEKAEKKAKPAKGKKDE
ncbi:MAG: 30S ribosomal protein S17 [Alphaproteobacteria bacterium]|nr:30S ribosomal protein S17 [Alphaproteobacteria bacterium]